ncbi:MAG TPA: apolipoprotein N-acyltransferase [Rhizobacter sp.]|nr:apolipoprotein N-acyltransferase [Rhizobacter sp.]
MLLGLYARGGAGWWLGFVALVPWLRTLDTTRTLVGSLLSAWAMSVAFVLAAFAWFGSAIGGYSQLGAPVGWMVLLIAAPLLQPQFFAFALVRHVASRRCGPMLCAFAGACTWGAAEWLAPKFLGDTLGHGLYLSALLRQAADVGGAAGLTWLLLLANEGVRAAVARRGDGVRAVAWPLALAALVPLLLAGYGAFAVTRLSSAAAPEAKPLRMGLVQSNIIDYDRLRREKGAEAVVREVLDTHFAMSYDAIERQHADAVLWSETVYPLTFGHPKNEAGAELDREILGIVNAAQVPFVFGTYDVDDAGEYNAAAFVQPGKGLLGFYRKTRLFPFTEYLPAWLDGPVVRGWLPWAGAWQAGNGARVFPLNLRDGREIPVLPLICLDDTDASLAIEGARQGAQAILTMSNDSWFTGNPLGAEMHQTVAAFRSIETRLPQFRVTANGHSAVIDMTGRVVAGTRMGERTLVIGDLPVAEPPRTLMVMWGDWVGRAAAAFLVLLAAAGFLRRWVFGTGESQAAADATALPANVVVLPVAARIVGGVLRAFARGSLLWMVAAFLLGDGSLPTNTLAQIRLFAALFLAPELAAWLVLRAFAARAALEQGALVLTRGPQRIELALRDMVAIEPWRLPVPDAGVSLRLASGQRHGLLHANPAALARVLVSAGAAVQAPVTTRSGLYAQVRGAVRRGWLDHLLVKFVLLPLVLAIPAFRLHQHVTFGSSFGEYEAFGLAAYLSAFALWWAAWIFGVALTASAVRAAVETGTLASVWLRPSRAVDVRRGLERLGLAALYLGMPAWLLVRVYAG